MRPATVAGLKAAFYELRFPFDHMEHIAAEHGGASKKSFDHYANCFQNLSALSECQLLSESFKHFQNLSDLFQTTSVSAFWD